MPATMPAVGGCQRGWCGNCKVMRALAGKLRVAGLNVTTIPYPHSPAGGAEVIQELEINNPAAPERGTFRITDGGEVMWELPGSLDSEQGMNEIAGVVAAMAGNHYRQCAGEAE